MHFCKKKIFQNQKYAKGLDINKLCVILENTKMFTKIYWVHQLDNLAKIGIMARPRGNDWLEDEINHLKNNGVDVLVSLLEKSEIAELGLEYEEKYCLAKNISYINLPIKDRDTPQDKNLLEKFIATTILNIKDGKSVVIHCRMGIGRASIIASSILLHLNIPLNEIIDNITRTRGLKIPDTEEQLAWLKSRE